MNRPASQNGQGGFGLNTVRTLKHLAQQARQKKDIWAHLTAHGGRYVFQERPVRLPRGTVLGLRHAIVSGGYEAAKRDLITHYLPSNLPVIELGGGLGLVGGFISEQLDIEVAHVIVEANFALADLCQTNATTARRATITQVLQKTIAYSGSGKANCKLSDILLEITVNNGYVLICDIAGAEFDVFEQDVDALQTCTLALVEVHPDVFESQGRSLSQFLDLVRAGGFQQVDHVENVYAFARA